MPTTNSGPRTSPTTLDDWLEANRQKRKPKPPSFLRDYAPEILALCIAAVVLAAAGYFS